MSLAYYNEIDKSAAQWLRNLINAGHIAPGIVDERSIEDVYPSDLRGFTQCHFFAGIGVWSHALRSAGWADDREIWTGSCPCQPFSAAGQGKGLADSRHLWPVWMELIATCSPRIIIGEQVASKGVVGYANEGLYGVRGGQTPRSVSEIFRQREARIEAAMQGVPEGVRKDLAVQFDRGTKSRKSEKKPENRDSFEGIQGQEPGGLLDFGVQEKEPKEGDSFRLGCACDSNTGAHIQGDLRGVGDCSCAGGCTGEGLQHPIAGQDRPKQGVCLRECSDRRLCGECDVGRLGGGCGDVNHQSVATKQGVKNDESRVSGAADAQDDGATGGVWLDLVFSDLEGSGYACAAIAFPSSGVGAPHIRDRLYWVADAQQHHRGPQATAANHWESKADRPANRPGGRGGVSGKLADDLLQQRPDGQPGISHVDDASGRLEGAATPTGLRSDMRPGPVNGFWRDADWLGCRDGKWRPVSPKPQPLVDGSAESLGRVRAETIEEIEGEINAWSMESQIDRDQALRNLLKHLGATAQRCWTPGGIPGLHEAPFLLAFLRQLAEQGWGVAQRLPISCEEVAEASVRGVWIDGEQAGAPRQHGLEEQQAGERANAVSFLSSLLARHALTEWDDAFAAYAETGFPLTHGARSRVTRLRAYGNAINSVAAQAFIGSVMEAA